MSSKDKPCSLGLENPSRRNVLFGGGRRSSQVDIHDPMHKHDQARKAPLIDKPLTVEEARAMALKGMLKVRVHVSGKGIVKQGPDAMHNLEEADEEDVVKVQKKLALRASQAAIEGLSSADAVRDYMILGFDGIDLEVMVMIDMDAVQVILP